MMVEANLAEDRKKPPMANHSVNGKYLAQEGWKFPKFYFYLSVYRDFRRENLRNKEIAVKYGLSKGQVRQIVADTFDLHCQMRTCVLRPYYCETNGPFNANHRQKLAEIETLIAADDASETVTAAIRTLLRNGILCDRTPEDLTIRDISTLISKVVGTSRQYVYQVITRWRMKQREKAVN